MPEHKPPAENTVANALIDLRRAVSIEETCWALLGGQALIAHGVPRDTLDADALIPPAKLEDVANTLVETFEWTPLTYSQQKRGYVETDEVTVQFIVDDPVLYDVGGERRMIALRTPYGLTVELLAAQHPVEDVMIDEALPLILATTRIPVAPLGGVLLVKTKANRKKDWAAIEQTAEHLSGKTLDKAIAWAREHDPGTAEELEAIVMEVHRRRTPARTKNVPRRGQTKKTRK